LSYWRRSSSEGGDQSITEPLLLVGTGSLLVIGAATLMIAALALWNGRKYVELIEGRMERLRAEQAHLLASLHKELLRLKEEPLREREEHPDSQRRVQRLSQECLRMRQEKAQLAEELERERVKRQEAQQRVRQEREARELERRARREVERRIDRLNRDLKEIPQEEDREVKRESPLPVLEELSEELPAAVTHKLLEKPLATQRASHEAEKPPRPVTPPKKKTTTTTSEPKEEVWPGEARPRLGRWIPHPDDATDKGTSPPKRERAHSSDDPVEMFRRHYDKYLDNYEGYLELIEVLYRLRESGRAKLGSLEEREWEKRLRRATEGIKRTNVRLDTLEEYNPELATDDRVSRRAVLARRHSELERSGQGHKRP
jgi:hypothetical protein